MTIRRMLVITVLLTCFLLFVAYTASAEETAQGGQSLEQAASDPTASLMSVQIQDVYTGGYHTLDGEDGNPILLRSAIPFKTGPLNHIARATLPIVTHSPSGKERPERSGALRPDRLQRILGPMGGRAGHALPDRDERCAGSGEVGDRSRGGVRGAYREADVGPV